MRKMATAFNTTVAALEDELTQLILEGLINARIDSHSKVSAFHPWIRDWTGVLSLETLHSCDTWKVHSSLGPGVLSRGELCVTSGSIMP